MFRWFLFIFDAVWVVALLLIPVTWFISPDPLRLELGSLRLLSAQWGGRVVLAFFGLGLLRGGLALLGRKLSVSAAGLWRWLAFRRVVLALLSVILTVSALEGLLAAFGYNEQYSPIVFAGGSGRTRCTPLPHMVPDPVLMWKFEPGTWFEGQTINSLGFRDQEVAAPKPPGMKRVICMGDSVAAQGRPGYARYLNDALRKDPLTKDRWQALGAGVYGYSVLQGLALYRTRLRALQPDIVTVCFGWNDHWRQPIADREDMATPVTPRMSRVLGHLRTKRIYMLMSHLMGRVHRVSDKPPTEKRVLRVPLAEYRTALGTLVAEIRADGAVPVLITAPNRALSNNELSRGSVTSLADGLRLHNEYVQATRDVAAKEHVVLLDLAQILAGPENDSLFAPDGIHFDRWGHEAVIPGNLPEEAQPGLSRVARELYRTLGEVVAAPAR